MDGLDGRDAGIGWLANPANRALGVAVGVVVEVDEDWLNTVRAFSNCGKFGRIPDCKCNWVMYEAAGDPVSALNKVSASSWGGHKLLST